MGCHVWNHANLAPMRMWSILQDHIIERWIIQIYIPSTAMAAARYHYLIIDVHLGGLVTSLRACLPLQGVNKCQKFRHSIRLFTFEFSKDYKHNKYLISTLRTWQLNMALCVWFHLVTSLLIYLSIMIETQLYLS